MMHQKESKPESETGFVPGSERTQVTSVKVIIVPVLMSTYTHVIPTLIYWRSTVVNTDKEG